MPDVQEAVRLFQDKRTVLSVDDDPVNQMVILTLFEAEGYTVLQAMDGKQALDVLDRTRADPPDVILLDIMMPQLSGYAVLDIIKVEHPPELPVIFISAKTTVVDKVEGLKHLCHDYQPKPFEKEELLHRSKSFMVLRNLRKLEMEMAAQLESLCAIAPQAVIDKFQAGSTVLNEKFPNVTFMDFYVPLSLFESALEQAIPYLIGLFRIIEDVRATSAAVKLLPLSGNGFRLISSTTDEKSKEVVSEISSKIANLLVSFELKTFKPFIVVHNTGPCAGALMNGHFHYVAEHAYFAPTRVAKKEESAAAAAEPSAICEMVDAETDNPFEEFEAALAARVAAVPPLPWQKKINEKAKIIVLEEMDLNDISEIFLLRSRVAFLEHQKGVTTAWKDRQPIDPID